MSLEVGYDDEFIDGVKKSLGGDPSGMFVMLFGGSFHGRVIAHSDVSGGIPIPQMIESVRRVSSDMWFGLSETEDIRGDQVRMVTDRGTFEADYQAALAVLSGLALAFGSVTLRARSEWYDEAKLVVDASISLAESICSSIHRKPTVALVLSGLKIGGELETYLGAVIEKQILVLGVDDLDEVTSVESVVHWVLCLTEDNEDACRTIESLVRGIAGERAVFKIGVGTP